MSGELLWLLNLLVLIGIYTLLAASLNLINGYAGMFNLGQHGFWAMGAYGALIAQKPCWPRLNMPA